MVKIENLLFGVLYYTQKNSLHFALFQGFCGGDTNSIFTQM